MMTTILFSNVLELLIFTFFYKSLLSPNNNNKHEYTIIYTLCFLTKCLSNFFNNIQINIAISFFTYLILILKFSNSKLIYKLLSLSIYEGLSIFSESITYHLFQLFPLANENELLQMFFSKFVLFLFIFDKKICDSKIYIKDILYIEFIDRKSMIHKLNGEIIMTNCTLKYWYDKLNIYSFAYPYKAFLVNLKYVNALYKKDIEMTNGEMIPLSRHYKKEFEAKYIDLLQDTL